MISRYYSAGNALHSCVCAECEHCTDWRVPCDHATPASVQEFYPCPRCQRDIHTCGHFGDCRDDYGPFTDRPNWMSTEQFQEAARWCAAHPDKVTWLFKGGEPHYPDGSLGTIPFLSRLVEQG